MAKEEYPIDLKVGIDLTDFSAKIHEAGAEAKTTFGKVGKSFDGKKLGREAQKAGKSMKGAFSGVSESFASITGVLKNIPGKVGQTAGQFQKMGKAMSGAGTAGKLALGGIIALIGVVLAKKIFDVSKQFGGMFDPVANEKATSKLNDSLKRMKTSLGAILEPLFEILAQVIGAIADGISYLVTQFMSLVGFVQGILGLGKSVNQTLSDTADSMEEASESASEGLSGWDKLNSIDLQNEGSMDQAKKIQETMDDAYSLGADIRGGFFGFFEGLPKAIGETFSSLWRSFTSLGREAWAIVSSLGQAVWTSLSDIGASAVSTIGSTVQSALSWVIDVFSDGFAQMVRGLSSLFDPVVSVVKWIADKVEDIVDGISSVTGGFLGSIVDGASSLLGGIKIPGFASGTVAMPNNPQLAIIGDNRREPEVVSPVSMIKQAVREVMAENTGGSSGPTEIVLKLDGKTLARYTYSDIRAEGIRRGDW